MDELTPTQVSRVLDVLMSQSFEEWYERSFMDYVEGVSEDSKEDIVEELGMLINPPKP